MVMESKIPPVIIPMWLTGFNQLMPEGRAFPYKYFPRPGAELTVTFGNPIPPNAIRQGLQGWDSGLDSRFVEQDEDPKGWLADEVQRRSERRHRVAPEGTARAAEELSKVRARVTAIIHDAVENLGRSVSGKSLYTPRRN